MRIWECADVFLRAVLILFIDTVLAKRTTWIFSLKDSLISWLAYKDTLYANGLSDELATFTIALGRLMLFFIMPIFGMMVIVNTLASL